MPPDTPAFRGLGSLASPAWFCLPAPGEAQNALSLRYRCLPRLRIAAPCAWPDENDSQAIQRRVKGESLVPKYPVRRAPIWSGLG